MLLLLLLPSLSAYNNMPAALDHGPGP